MASASIPVVESIPTELLEGETVTVYSPGTPEPQNPQNANDRNHATTSLLQAGFAAGTVEWGWVVDFGSPDQEEGLMRIVGPTVVVFLVLATLAALFPSPAAAGQRS